MKAYLKLLKSELYKTIRFKPLGILYGIIMLFVVFIFVWFLNLDQSRFNNMLNNSGFDNVWLFYYDFFVIIVSAILPFIIAIFIFVLRYFEIQANSNHLLQFTPHHKMALHLSKISVAFFAVTTFLFLFYLLLILTSQTFFLTRPELGGVNFENKSLVLLLHILSNLEYSISLILLFYLLSLVIKNFALLIAVSFLSFIFSFFLIPDYLNIFSYFIFSVYEMRGNLDLPQMASRDIHFFSFHVINKIYILFFIIVLVFLERRKRFSF